MDEPVWLTETAVHAIHQQQLAEHGGLGGVREPGGADSALARPRQLFAYGEPPPDLAAMAAAYAGGFVRNDPFVDGNKRVALVVARTFLKLNGWNLVAPPEAKYLAMIGLATRELSEEEFAAWIRANLAPWVVRPPPDPPAPGGSRGRPAASQPGAPRAPRAAPDPPGTTVLRALHSDAVPPWCGPLSLVDNCRGSREH